MTAKAGPLVVVPSYGRAGRVTTVNVFPEGVVVVPASQAKEYRQQALPQGWSVDTVPDNADGNIARKRNAILAKYKGRDIVMVDDDYEFIARHERMVEKRLDHDQIRHMLREGFRMARELGTIMWGINLLRDPKAYRPFAPLATISPILGPFTALTAERPDDLRYDEDLFLKEDYDFALEVLRRYRCVLRFSMFHYMVDHFNDVGGVVHSRSMSEEIRQDHRLQAKWGRDVVRLDLSKSVNPKLQVPLKGM